MSNVINDNFKYQQIAACHNGSCLFHSLGRGSFYINSKCVLEVDHVVTINHFYLLIDAIDTSHFKVFPVVLLHFFLRDGNIHLIVKDVVTSQMLGRKHVLYQGETKCKWVLIDPLYFKHKSDREAIIDYCENY
jgi:hypothetical protein